MMRTARPRDGEDLRRESFLRDGSLHIPLLAERAFLRLEAAAKSPMTSPTREFA